MTNITAIVVAAGNSSRMDGVNKLTYVVNKVSGFTTLESAVYPFVINSEISDVIIVVSKNSEEESKRLQAKYPKIRIVFGGATRSESVKNALDETRSDYVLIHDGARPYLTTALIDRLISEVKLYDSAIPYVDAVDSEYYVKSGEYLDRSSVKRIQTPQAFKTSLIKNAIKSSDLTAGDEGVLFNKYVKPIHLVKGEEQNIKITTRHDIDQDIRVGVGYDVHKLVENRKLILGGIDVPNRLGLLGHSDADVLTHAIMDALLGAVGLRDIGYYFPDNDDKYLNADSLMLLDKVIELLHNEGYYVNNVSAEILAERPKLKPVIPLIRQNLAKRLSIDESKISITATTTETLGIIGEEKGMACYSVCSVKAII